MTQCLGWAEQRWRWRGEGCGGREVLCGDDLLAAQVKFQALVSQIFTERVPEAGPTETNVSMYAGLNPFIIVGRGWGP